MIRVLLVEDEPRMREALGELMRQEGYLVDEAADGEKGLEAMIGGSFDMAVLDVMLPGVSGLEIASAARRAGVDVPILMLTARSGLDDKVAGLDSGADDYLTKPFEPRELLARLRALMRRVPDAEGDYLSFGDLRLNTKEALLCRDDQKISLTLREARMLEVLMRCRGRTAGKEQLAVQTFGYEDEGEYNKVEVYMSFLRKKLSFLGSRVSVKTERGRGYRLWEERHGP